MHQPKNTDWLNGHKNKIHIHCCLQETHFRHRDTYRLKVERMKKRYSMQIEIKAGVAIIISGKIDFKIKTRDGRTLHNDQGVNLRRHNNCKYLCTQHRSISIHKTNTSRHKRGN